jgi:transposase InsO family protein
MAARIRRQYLSYIPTGEGWLYLAAIKDVATREIVGWGMADHLREELARDALLMAIRRRQPPPGLIHHSDRGVQGGFKWSSQHLMRSYDDQMEAAIGSFRESSIALARSTTSGRA